MKRFRCVILILGVWLILPSTGCHEHKKTTKITAEGPNKKHEIKIETTEKDHD